ncbi:MAG: efflux RND transporter permease subunit [Pseudomonadota bacterium]
MTPPSTRARAFDPIKSVYRALLTHALANRGIVLVATAASLALGIAGIATAPKKFWPDSDRAQILADIDLPAGVTADRTNEAIQDLVGTIENEGFDWLDNHVAHVGFGGPRFCPP